MTGNQDEASSVADPPPKETIESGSSLHRTIGDVAVASAVALIFGEVVTLGQTVALARLLTPAQVGLFVAGTVLTTFLGNFVEGGLRSGLIHRDKELADAADTVFWVTMIAGLLMSLATLAISPLVGLAFHSRQAGLISAASSGVLFLYSFTNVPEALLQREFSIRRRLIVGPAVGVSYATVAVTLAAQGWGVWSMLGGLYASYVVWVASVWMITDWRPGRGHPSVRLWRELSRYGLPLVLGMVGARIQSVVEAVVVGRGLSASGLGQYRYGQRIAMIPQRAIIEVGAIALFPAFSRISGDPVRLKPAYLRAIHWATIGAAALSGLMIALGVPTVVVVLGPPWREAGVVVTAMAGLGLGKALISVSEEAIKGGGRTKLLNWYTLTEVTLGLVLLIVLIRPLGLVGVGLAVSLTSLAVGVTCVALARIVVGFSLREVAVAVLPQLPCAAVAAAACWATEHLLLHSDTHPLVTAVTFLLIDGVVFTGVYLAGLALIMPATMQTMLNTVLKLIGKLFRRGSTTAATAESKKRARR